MNIVSEKNLCKEVVLGVNPSASQDEIDYVYREVWIKMPFHYENFRSAIGFILATNKSKCDRFYEEMLDEAWTDNDPLDALLVGVGIDRDNTYFLRVTKLEQQHPVRWPQCLACWQRGWIREFLMNFKVLHVFEIGAPSYGFGLCNKERNEGDASENRRA